jgi:hypothetical protein
MRCHISIAKEGLSCLIRKRRRRKRRRRRNEGFLFKILFEIFPIDESMQPKPPAASFVIVMIVIITFDLH